jgi:hypothetical protein
MDIALFDDSLHIVPGIRLEPYVTSVNKALPVVGDNPPTGVTTENTVVDPRLALRYKVSSKLSTKAAFGIYHQAPEPEDLSSVFGNPNLAVSSAIHGLVGALFKVTDIVSLETVGFYAKSDDLVSRSPLGIPPGPGPH